MKRTFSSTVRSSETSPAPRSRKNSTRRSTSSSGALAPEVIPTVSTPSSQPSSTWEWLSIRCERGAVLAGDLDQAVGVRGVGRADHQHQVAFPGELLDRDLAVGGRVTDVVALRADDRGEAGAQPGDDLGRLVDREGGLGDEGDALGVGDLDLVHLFDGLHEDDAVGRLPGGAFHLLVALVPDQDHRVAVGGELAGLDVNLGDQRAGGVDRPQLPGGGVPVHRRSHPVGREDDHLALRHLGLLLDEDRPALAQLLDHVLVVDDLLADVDRRAVDLQGSFDRLHGAIDPGAVTARRREQDLSRTPRRRSVNSRRHHPEGNEGLGFRPVRGGA